MVSVKFIYKEVFVCKKIRKVKLRNLGSLKCTKFHRIYVFSKVNVMGRKCDICKEGTFGLHAENIDGCTACFCFGRSTLCTEAGLIWSQIKLRPDRKLVVHYDTNSTSSNLNTTDIYPVNTQQICFINVIVRLLKSYTFFVI